MDAETQFETDWRIIGHEFAVESLRRSLRNSRQRHAYLFTGPPALGKDTLARAFAMTLNCEAGESGARPCRRCRACRAIERSQDPDLIVATGDDGAPLKIEAIREATRLLALKPYAARYRIAILRDFDRVAPLAQDALLKTLEEPAAQAILLLLASSGERILPTIRSRAQTIALRPLPVDVIQAALGERGCDEDRAELIARLSAGRVGWALRASADDELMTHRGQTLDRLREIADGGRLERIQAADELSRTVGRDKAALRVILEIWLSYWRDVLLQCLGSPIKPCNSDRSGEIRTRARRIEPEEALDAVKATGRAIEALSTNANVRLSLDALFLDYPGLG